MSSDTSSPEVQPHKASDNDTGTPISTLHGNCHCGAIKFDLTITAPVKETEHCVCSHCRKIDSYWIGYDALPNDAFKITKGEDQMMEYQYGPKHATLKFCPTCGTMLLYLNPKDSKKMVNARAIQDFDVFSHLIKESDAVLYGPPHPPHKYAGPEKVASPGEKVYTGGCHCGNVTIALKTKPLSEVEIRRCDCSICTRNGYVFAYPNKDDVGLHVSDPSHLKVYRHGRKWLEHVFCDVCAVPLFIRVLGPPAEKLTSDTARAHAAEMVKLMPMNLHVLDGVEWDSLKITKTSGKDMVPKYVVPE